MASANYTLKYMLAVFILSPLFAAAHSAHDPVKEIHKKDQTIATRQSEFDQLQYSAQKIENLQDQITAMESKILMIRNLMVSDYPHIKEKMSKYSFDYIKSVEESLAQLKSTLQQTDTLLNQ